MLCPPSTSRTASCLNSSVYRALVFLISDLLAQIEPRSKGYVFRGQGQPSLSKNESNLHFAKNL
ncbi:MAG: hypothetical protein ACK6DI_05445, partial [Betaproteobacteria bacterium]